MSADIINESSKRLFAVAPSTTYGYIPEVENLKKEVTKLKSLVNDMEMKNVIRNTKKYRWTHASKRYKR